MPRGPSVIKHDSYFMYPTGRPFFIKLSVAKSKEGAVGG